MCIKRVYVPVFTAYSSYRLSLSVCVINTLYSISVMHNDDDKARNRMSVCVCVL